MKNEEFSKLVSRKAGGQQQRRSGSFAGEEEPLAGQIDTKTIVRREIERDEGEKRKHKALKRKHGQARDKGEGKKSKQQVGDVNDEQGEDLNGEKYRDRAAERRRDIETATDATDFSTLSLRPEETQFLGGDEEHAHLVKGLDFALLRKMRGKISAAKESPETPKLKQEAVQTTTAKVRTGLAKRLMSALKVFEVQSLSNLNASAATSTTVDRFQPRRNSYMFDIKTDMLQFAYQIPTGIQRSRADCPVPPRRLEVRIDSETDQKLHKVMTHVRAVTGRKVANKRRHRPSPGSDQVTMVGRLVARDLEEGGGCTQAAKGSAKSAVEKKPIVEALLEDTELKANVRDSVEVDLRPGDELFQDSKTRVPETKSVAEHVVETRTGGYFGEIVRKGVQNIPYAAFPRQFGTLEKF
uniref:RED-like N-terminal domain-containing protein n=1 Tax=Rhodosorus marinus TaxID=101924 RepID=A0A7S3E8F0_9RHOD|mmetsp:Transcript_13973/g.56265  ORF Transcript_13973/g.56265 Transcript_13973/m.56265 type:complete len:411 (+) Transcript_13973:144-1376(+)